MRGGLRIGRDPLPARDRRIAHGDVCRRAHRRALDHRAPGGAAGIVRIGEPGPCGVLHARGRQVALRQRRPGIARHVCGSAGVPRHRAGRRGSCLADGAGGRPWILGMGRHAAERPQHRAADRKHGQPGEQAHDPGGAVDPGSREPAPRIAVRGKRPPEPGGQAKDIRAAD